jgi:hypothetical protein
VYAAGPGHTAEVQKLLGFYKQCALAPRFNADNILGEVSMATELSALDAAIYRYILIPWTRERFFQQDPVIVDAALWRHSREPRSAPQFEEQMQSLATELKGAEQASLLEYLKTLR